MSAHCCIKLALFINIEVSHFVPKLGTLVLSVLYFQFSSLSLKCTYLRAFFFLCHPNSDNQRHSPNQRLRKTLVSYTTNVISPFYSEPLRPSNRIVLCSSAGSQFATPSLGTITYILLSFAEKKYR